MKALFDGMDLRTLLTDLRSVKMPPVDRARAGVLCASRALSAAQVGEVWALVRRFRRQLEELHAARERARETNGRARIGLTRAAVRAAQEQRQQAEEEARNDLGL